MEDFVPFLLAKKLKEKGFKEKCYAYYFPVNNELCYNINQFRGGNLYDCLYSHNSLPEELVASDFIDAPTISQVLKWLEKKKYIFVCIEFFNYEIGFGYKLVRLDYVDNITENQGYKTYELAALAGIKHVINNII